MHDDDVARPQCRQEYPFNISPKAFAIDRAVDEPGCLDTITPQGGQEGHGFPAAMRHLGGQALAARRPASERGHVGSGPGLVDEDQTGRFDPVPIAQPLRPSPCDIAPIPLAGDQRLFL
jgi:hypothetical protein